MRLLATIVLLGAVLSPPLHAQDADAATVPADAAAEASSPGVPLAEIRRFVSVYNAVRQAYVDPVDDEELMRELVATSLARLGHRNVAVYDGSMSEWSADPDAPMEVG